MNISQWKIGDRTFFPLEVDDHLLLAMCWGHDGPMWLAHVSPGTGELVPTLRLSHVTRDMSHITLPLCHTLHWLCHTESRHPSLTSLPLEAARLITRTTEQFEPFVADWDYGDSQTTPGGSAALLAGMNCKPCRQCLTLFSLFKSAY